MVTLAPELPGATQAIRDLSNAGVIVAVGHTEASAFLLLGRIGSMRMFLELIFKVAVPGYAPGKFKSMTGPFTEWMTLRRHFLLPYVMTWALYIVLSSHASGF